MPLTERVWAIFGLKSCVSPIRRTPIIFRIVAKIVLQVSTRIFKEMIISNSILDMKEKLERKYQIY